MDIYSTKPAPYVYMCVHIMTGEFYFGYREKNVRLNRTSYEDFPLYKSSSLSVKPRFDEFAWSILAEFLDGIAAYDFEQSLINEHWGHPLLLNKMVHQNGHNRFKNNIQSEETKKKIGDANRGKKKPPRTEEYRKKISEALSGRIRSEEHKDKFRGENNPMFGKHHSSDARQKISQSQIGKKMNLSSEALLARSENGKRNKGHQYRLGSTLSDEAKAKISAANSGRPAWNKGMPDTRCSCIHCHKEVTPSSLARYHSKCVSGA